MHCGVIDERVSLCAFPHYFRAAQRKALRNAILQQLHREDVIKQERDVLFGTAKQAREMRYCTEQTVEIDGKRVIQVLRDDPVFTGTIAGIHTEALSETHRTQLEREMNEFDPTVQKTRNDRTSRILHRNAKQQAIVDMNKLRAIFATGPAA